MEHFETTRETFRKSCYCLCIRKRLGNDGGSVVVNIRKKEDVVKDVSDLNSISDNPSGILCHVGVMPHYTSLQVVTPDVISSLVAYSLI
ncbi:hypothetical protein AVEN_132181-1 [Araneus ventricosus]|uniref:Uncharacterized protein n=1 Tax=Araneus ventricosus TaxID=182803 RepID=A0A4Y2P768_ARAVE|nr:hypothetical protein AVEN_132181-1 [Araneus ventricosus]